MKLSPQDEIWLKQAQQYPYASLSKESQIYYDDLMQKKRIPEAIEKGSTHRSKKLKAPTKQPQKKAAKGEAKMLVFMIGFVIIGFAARMLWLDWKKPISKTATEKVASNKSKK